ncbi:CHAP domain-containing protein [Nonomuraea sp. NPDC050536]|uniref:CHAP domain-containing protein n=1 Tax=Nonomuraea sp. NPDC050536 TaxID=3364366 RepID=UPI0037C5B1CC
MGAALLGVLLAPFMMFAATTAALAATGSDIENIVSTQNGHGPCESNFPYKGTGYGSACSGEDWCAYFARWVWAMAGISVTSSLTPYVPDWAHSTGTHTWHPYGDHYTPHVGDAVIFAHADTSGCPTCSQGAHVAIVEAVSGDQVEEIGGNQGNVVSRSWFTPSAGWNGDTVLGYLSATPHLYALGPSSDGVFQWSGSGSKWSQVGGPAGTVYTGGLGTFATNPATGDLYRYDETTNGWGKVGGPGYTFAVTNTALYGLAPNKNAVYQWNGSGTGWTQIGGPAGYLYSGGFGLFATNPATGDLYRYNGSPNNWSKVGGPGYTFAVTDNALYGLSPDQNAVFKWNGSGTNWTQIGGRAAYLDGGGKYLVAINFDTSNVYLYNGSPNSWSQIGGPGYTFKSTSEGLYAVSPNQDAVFRWNGSGTGWTQIGGPADNIFTQP